MSNKKFDLKKLINRLVLFISLGILAHIIFLLITTDSSIFKELSKINLKYLILIGGLMMCPWLGHAFRLKLWTGFLGYKIPYRESLKIVVSNDLGSALTPTLIGGGPIKLGMLINRGLSATHAGFVTLLNGLEDLIFYITGFLLTAIFARQTVVNIFEAVVNLIKGNWKLIVIIALAILLFAMLHRNNYVSIKNPFSKWIPRKWSAYLGNLRQKMGKSIKEMGTLIKLIIRSGKWRFLLSIIILFGQWMAKFSVLIVIISALDIDVEAYEIYLKQWMVWLTMIFIPTPGASGGAEASFLLIFGSTLPESLIHLIVSIWRFFTYYFVLFAAVIIFQITSALGRSDKSNYKEVH